MRVPPQPGDRCERCEGTGRVFGEVFANEWTDCPYWDHELGLECVAGVIRETHEKEPA